MADNNVLSAEEIADRLQGLEQWQSENDEKITKTFEFKNFKEALAFTNQVGEVAEGKMHHPDIYLTWGKVTIAIQTHEAGGLTADDFELAQAIDEIDDEVSSSYIFWS